MIDHDVTHQRTYRYGADAVVPLRGCSDVLDPPRDTIGKPWVVVSIGSQGVQGVLHTSGHVLDLRLATQNVGMLSSY